MKTSGELQITGSRNFSVALDVYAVVESRLRTWWFLALCVLAVARFVRPIYGDRLAQLEKINEARSAFTQHLIEY